MNTASEPNGGNISDQVTWMPCLQTPGLALFGPSADQRAALGEDIFRATHFPMVMRTQNAGKLINRVTQDDLLTDLLHTEKIGPGNRIFVLYGAAGAGKSELLRWLAVEISATDPLRAHALMRVSRTELDVLRIVERFHSDLSGRFFSSQTHARWEDLRTKPLTLAKLIVLSALEHLLTSDTEINTLFYWLVDPVQRNLEAGLSYTPATGPDDSILELFSEEDWQNLTRTTELSQQLELEALREALGTSFRNLLLENVYIPDTLRLLSEEIVRRHNVRPILLIDDLVRSLNIFAGDIMDYFITLEAGNWDVVMGLTPASLQMHVRGKNLLERIAYLDTIDDRVQKLWLSDDYGYESYFLNEANCAAFASIYLDEYRRLNGVSCRICAQQDRCAGLGQSEDGRLLAPLNENVLQRVMRSLPSGKGKARYFLRALGEVLTELASGASLPETMKGHSHREYMARTESRIEGAIVELYGKPNKGISTVTVEPGVERFFGMTFDRMYSVEPLTLSPERLAEQPVNSLATVTEDPERDAIRRWLEGNAANRQLLRSLRQGVARWLRIVDPPHILARRGKANPHGVLRWDQPYLDITPPILLEGIDPDQRGISISPSLGMLAFDIAFLAKASGNDVRSVAFIIGKDEAAFDLVQKARRLQSNLFLQLEEQLGMSSTQLAFHLYVFALCLGEKEPQLPGFPNTFWSWLPKMQARHSSWRREIHAKTRKAFVHLFEDFFLLRKNVVDGPEISRLCSTCESSGYLGPIMDLVPDRLDSSFTLGGESLSDVLGQVRKVVGIWLQGQNATTMSPSAHNVLHALEQAGGRGIALTDIPLEVIAELEESNPAIFDRLRVWWARDQSGNYEGENR